MNAEQAKLANAQIDKNTKAFNSYIHRYCEPPKEPLAQKWLTIRGVAEVVEVEGVEKFVVPIIDVVTAGDEIFFVQQNISEKEFRKFLNPQQKSALTRAQNADLQRRRSNLQGK